MKIELKRVFRGPKYTIGKLYIDGTYFCDTLEDIDRGLSQNMTSANIRAIKLAGITAIPTGTYKISLDMVSPKYGGREPYKTECKGRVPRLLDVPGFEGILIHIGNTPEDTDGCILLGFNRTVGQVNDSKVTWVNFSRKIKGQKDLTITIS